ncbi:MAG TPA: PD-(D/E)XK nuclease family protein [Nitrospiraceae bacterium]
MPMVDSKPREFAWSYSRLNAFEICPRRFNEVMVKKAWPEERSENLEMGDAVHAAMATALKTGTDLPLAYTMYQPWIDKVNRTQGELLVEDQCRWAITREFKPTAWFSRQVWARSVADAVKVNDDVALVVDWKTGKSANADPMQLELTSLIALSQFPKLQAVRADFVWLQEDDHTTISVYRKEAADKWAEILPRVEKLQAATAANEFPPKPNRFCSKWCPVRTCEYWGR